GAGQAADAKKWNWFWNESSLGESIAATWRTGVHRWRPQASESLRKWTDLHYGARWPPISFGANGRCAHLEVRPSLVSRGGRGRRARPFSSCTAWPSTPSDTRPPPPPWPPPASPCRP